MARSKSMQDFSDSGSFSDGCGLNRMSEIEDAIKRYVLIDIYTELAK